MNLKHLRERVCRGNLALVEHGLVMLTWGNVSGRDCSSDRVVIKPSGMPYDDLKPSAMITLDMDGRAMDGDLSPSMDTATHLALYRAWPEIRGVVHAHSCYATAFAQAGCSIPCMGTTHADTFCGDIPLTRWLTAPEVRDAYEVNTGAVIVGRFNDLDPLAMPGVIVAGHGPFVWGRSVEEAVHNAVVLEYAAKSAWLTRQLNPDAPVLPDYLLDKHYRRKHGTNAYYGQKG